MAILQPMRYKDYVWPHNPETYTVTYRRRVGMYDIPYGLYAMESLGRTCRVMTGSGEFVGPDAYEEFKRLATVYYTGGEGILVHPCWQSAHVLFTALSLRQEPRPDYVAYTFEFRELYDGYDTELKEVDAAAAAAGSGSSGGAAAAAAAADSAVPRYVVVCRGDSLWAIARSSGSTVEQLLALNPSIKNPNLIYAGQKVRVA